ncbi:hypothetical protein JRQ81_019552, partial [Phrynocephalus forsythii]
GKEFQAPEKRERRERTSRYLRDVTFATTPAAALQRGTPKKKHFGFRAASRHLSRWSITTKSQRPKLISDNLVVEFPFVM